MQPTRLPKLLTTLAVIAAAVACPVAASAAQAGDSTFSKSGAPFTFSYPSSFQQASYSGGTKLNKPAYEVAFGISSKDYLLVQTYSLKISVKGDGSGTDPSGKPMATPKVDQIIDATIGQLTKTAGFTDQAPVATGRLGSLRARIFHVMTHDRKLASVIYVALSGKTEYYLACQTTPKGQDQVAQACQRLATTFVKR